MALLGKVITKLRNNPFTKTTYYFADRLEDALAFIRRLATTTWAFAKNFNDALKLEARTGNYYADHFLNQAADNLSAFAFVGAAIQIPLLVHKMVYAAFFSKEDRYSRVVQFLLVGAAAVIVAISILVMAGVISIGAPYLILAGAIRGTIEHGVSLLIALKNRFWGDSKTTRETKKNLRHILKIDLANLKDEIHRRENEITILKQGLTHDDSEEERARNAKIERKMAKLDAKKLELADKIAKRDEALLDIDGPLALDKIAKRRKKLIELLEEKRRIDRKISRLKIEEPDNTKDIDDLEKQKDQLREKVNYKLDSLLVLHNRHVERNDRILSKMNATGLALGMLVGAILLFTPASAIGVGIVIGSTAVALADVGLLSVTGKNTVQWIGRGFNHLVGWITGKKPITLDKKARYELLDELTEEMQSRRKPDDEEPGPSAGFAIEESESPDNVSQATSHSPPSPSFREGNAGDDQDHKGKGKELATSDEANPQPESTHAFLKKQSQIQIEERPTPPLNSMEIGAATAYPPKLIDGQRFTLLPPPSSSTSVVTTKEAPDYTPPSPSTTYT